MFKFVIKIAFLLALSPVLSLQAQEGKFNSTADEIAYHNLLAVQKPTSKDSVVVQPRAAIEKVGGEEYPYYGYFSGSGIYNFQPSPFKEKAVFADDGLTHNSYTHDGKLYCYRQNTTGSYVYPNNTRTVYSTDDFELLEQGTLDNVSKKREDLPYFITYDDVTGVVYTIMMGDRLPGTNTHGCDAYYLGTIDEATGKVRKIGLLGTYYSSKEKDNFSVRGLTAHNGKLYVLYKRDGVYSYGIIDPFTLEVKQVGEANEEGSDYLNGFQPFVYDKNLGTFLHCHNDLFNGARMYKVELDENHVVSTLLNDADNGFTFMYADDTEDTKPLAMPTDFNVSVEGDKATVSATLSPLYATDIAIPSSINAIVDCNLLVDGEPTGVTTKSTLGSHISMSANVAQGPHTVTLQVVPASAELRPYVAGGVIICGNDAPAEVGNVTLNYNANGLTVAWSAPENGLYSDFDSQFDASDITYKVIRNFDGKVLADGIAETTITDTDITEYIRSYSYTITAMSHGISNRGTKSSTIAIGNYMELPYSTAFYESSDYLGWSVANYHNGSYGWEWSKSLGLMFSNWGLSDAWTYTPPFKVENGKSYKLTCDVRGAGMLYITMGDDAVRESQTTTLDTLRNTISFDADKPLDSPNETKEYVIRPDYDGYLYFGFHNYNSDEGQCWWLDNVRMEEYGDDTNPGAIADATFTPDAEGALGATIEFTAPKTRINGTELSSLSHATIYNHTTGATVAETATLTPGAKVSLHVPAQHGWNQYSITVEDGASKSDPLTFCKFVGPDAPKPITDLVITWGSKLTQALLSWNVSVEGANGGYVDPAKVTYNLYQANGNAYSIIAGDITDNFVDIDISNATKKQAQYVFGITAVNEMGESEYTRRGIVLGEAYSLPFSEAFKKEGVTTTLWTIISGINDEAWRTDAGSYTANIDAVDNDGLKIMLQNKGVADGSSIFCTPVIDFTKAEHPMMSVWIHHTAGLSDNAYVDVKAITDGDNRNLMTVSEKQSVTGNCGWTEHFFDLSALVGKKAQVGLEAYVSNPSERIFADKWSIQEMTGKDLAITSISQPRNAKVGDKFNVDVTVANKGSEEASGYSVLFNLNGETVALEEPADIKPGENITVQFPLTIMPGNDDILYSAIVEFDGDIDEDNNESSEVEITPEQVELNAPTNLSVESANQISWTAPEMVDGREVMLDFEDEIPFSIDNFQGWRTVDEDKNLTSVFTMYYENYWPYAMKPMAWMVWSPSDTGAGEMDAWQPYEGKHCLVAWGNWGYDENNHTDSDDDSDWLISPEIKGGTQLSFKDYSMDTNSQLEILVSTTDCQPSSFKKRIGTTRYTNMAKWYERSYTLPENAKYVALHTTYNGFGILVDNLQYTLANGPQLQGYNVYRGNELYQYVTENTAYVNRDGKYSVSAVYDLGESVRSNVIDVTDGIEDVIADDDKVNTIYDLQGRRVNSPSHGVYIVNGKKVVIK